MNLKNIILKNFEEEDALNNLYNSYELYDLFDESYDLDCLDAFYFSDEEI